MCRIWLYQHADYEALNDALESCLPLPGILEVSGCESVLDGVLLNRSKVHSFKAQPPWITKEVRHSLASCDCARRVAKHANTAASWQAFCHRRNEAVSALRRAKKQYFCSCRLFQGILEVVPQNVLKHLQGPLQDVSWR